MVEYRSYFPKQSSFVSGVMAMVKAGNPLSREGLLVASTVAGLGWFVLVMVLTLVTTAIMPLTAHANPDDVVKVVFGSFLVINLIFALIILRFMARRLKDMGKSGYWIWLWWIGFLVPALNVYLLLYLGLRPGLKANNPYGNRVEQGQAIIRRYYNENLSFWTNVVNFYMKTPKRANRLPYFWGNILLVVANTIAQLVVMIPVAVAILAEGLADYSFATNSFYATNMTLGKIPTILILIFYVLYMIFSLVTMFFGITLKIKRCHDINLSGWWLLLYVLALVPVLGAVMIMVLELFLWCKKGTVGANKYGEDPLEVE